MRGLLAHLFTRIYFSDETNNARDHGAAARAGRAPCCADREVAKAAGEIATYRFDVHMRGDKETVFFDV